VTVYKVAGQLPPLWQRGEVGGISEQRHDAHEGGELNHAFLSGN
jgi:hypothetical protein